MSKNFKKITIGDYCTEIIKGVSFDKGDALKESRRGYIPLFRANNIADMQVNFDDLIFVDEKKVKDTQILKDGDIIFTTSSGSRHLVGKSALIDGLKNKTTFGAFLSLLRLNSFIHPKFAFYAFNSILFKNHIIQRLVGVNINNIKKDDILSFEILVPFKNNQPDLEEQKRIVDKIDKLFAEIEKGSQTITEMQKSRTNLLFSAFKKSFYKEIKNSKSFNIGDLTKTIAGGTPSTTKKEYWDNGSIPWLNSGALKNNDISEPSKYITELGLKNSPAKLMPKDTVVIALTGATTGLVGYLLFESSANQSVVGILPSDKLHSRYLFYFLISHREELVKMQSIGAAQPHINKRIVDDTKIPIPTKNGKPDLEEQKKIAFKLNNIKQQIKSLDNIFAKQLNDFNFLKQSILQKSFEGKLVAVEEPVLQKVNIFPIQQAVGAVLQRFERGEMVIAKILYLAQTINRVPLGISFTPQNFGPYDTAVKKAITAGLSRGNKFFTRKKYGNDFIYTLSSNAQKLFKYSNSKVLRTMNGFLNEMMPYFKKSSSADIERLASVCEIIRETKNTDEEEVYRKLSEWKPNRFNLQEVQRTLSFIKTKGWDKILI
jgi:restriction endonuclease S subunit